MLTLLHGGWGLKSAVKISSHCLQINPKSTRLFSPGTAQGGVFHPLCNIRSRHHRELKLTGLIAYIMFYKIYKFESSTVTNDVIMTSLPKTMAKFGPPQTKQIIYHSKGIDESYSKMYFY